MKILNADARAFAAALITGADQAEKAGQPSFDVVESLQVLATESLDELQTAIEHARSSG